MSDDPIADALRAEAEQARAEMRAAGISCPSCGVNMADLPDGHRLAMSGGRKREDASLEPMTARCARGEVVRLDYTSGPDDAAFEIMQAVANVSLLDDFWAREAEAVGRIIPE